MYTATVPAGALGSLPPRIEPAHPVSWNGALAAQVAVPPYPAAADVDAGHIAVGLLLVAHTCPVQRQVALIAEGPLAQPVWAVQVHVLDCGRDRPSLGQHEHPERLAILHTWNESSCPRLPAQTRQPRHAAVSLVTFLGGIKVLSRPPPPPLRNLAGTLFEDNCQAHRCHL